MHHQKSIFLNVRQFLQVRGKPTDTHLHRRPCVSLDLRSHKSRQRTISGSVRGKQGQGVRRWRRGGREMQREEGDQSQHCSSAVRPSWSFLFFLAWDCMPCPAAQMQPEPCRLLLQRLWNRRWGGSCTLVAQGRAKIAPALRSSPCRP